MNNVQRKVLTYLADPARSTPSGVLQDLTNDRFFRDVRSEEFSASQLDRYINESDWCDDGKDRARRFFADVLPKPKTAKASFIIEVELDEAIDVDDPSHPVVVAADLLVANHPAVVRASYRLGSWVLSERK